MDLADEGLSPAPRRGASPKRTAVVTAHGRPPCCPKYHRAIELIGRRWTGAIVSVLIHRERLRFSEIADAVPELSDRLLSARMKELEALTAMVNVAGDVPADGSIEDSRSRHLRAA